MKRFDYLVRQNIGDPGSIKLRNVFPLISVLPKPPQLPYGVKKTTFSCPHTFSKFNTTKNLLERQFVKESRLRPPPQKRVGGLLRCSHEGGIEYCWNPNWNNWKLNDGAVIRQSQLIKRKLYPTPPQ